MDTQKVAFDNEAVEALRVEFFSNIASAKYAESMRSLLSVSGSQMHSKAQPKKGADLYTLRKQGKLVGVLLNTYYAWNSIRPQLNFRPRIERNEVVGLSLSRFEDMMPKRIKRKVAGELAYFWVHPAFRGQGIGTQLFDLSLTEFKTILRCGDVVFTLAMGNFVRDPIWSTLQKYLLSREQVANGTRADGTIKVTGVEVSAMRILKDIGLDVTRLTPSSKSKATEILAKKRGFKFRGYSKNLSVMYTKP